MATSSLTDAINQNTPGNSQGFPLGVPTSYDWYSGSNTVYGNKPPSNFTSVTGWGQVYPEVGAAVDPNATVQIADFETFVHLTNGTWVQVQNQSSDQIAGAHFTADFSGSANVSWKETIGSDGSASVDAPQSGYNDHFWPGARGTYAAGTVDGVFVEAEMKTNDPNANLVANVGADWWLSPSAQYVNGFANNPSPGMSDWVKLTTSYQTLYFSSLSPAELAADPPPGMSTSSSSTAPPVTTPPVTTPPVTTPPVTTPPAITPAVTQATASPGSGVANVGDKVTLTLAFNEAVTVTGKPTLTLNDGDVATYVSGSGTSKLVFSTTVAATDTTTAALAITGVNVPSGASIKDASGVSANLAGAATTFTGLAIDPPTSTPPVTTPPVTTPPAVHPAVTQATASPGTGIEQVGAKVALTLDFNEAVSVAGKPTLTLNDGSTATYVSGSGTDKLVFSTTVASTNTATSALAITGVNVPSGASIKDASGVSANLAGAATTFTGLQIKPSATTPPVTTPPVTTPPATSGATKPVLTVADNTLSVDPGGKVNLGIGVSTTDKNDAVSVNIKGLARYETITDNLDGHTFTGKNITLTAAEVESGLTLHSNYRGWGNLTATLSVTATGKDPSTGTVATSAAKTITVTDPPPATAGGSSSSGGGYDHHHSFALLSQSLAGGLQGHADLGQMTTAASHASSWLNEALLSRPQH
jgi:hypothetical protein